MARVTLGSGETITIGGTTDVFGTTGEQTINVLDGSTVNFRGGFNSGETDTIRLNGNASDFVISAVGLTVTLFSAVDNIRIVLPIGANGANIVFDNGDTRTITREGASGTKISSPSGDQIITGTAVALAEGAGVYEVTSDGEVLEGGVLTFTVTRTDGSFAETLQATALGFTNGGTIVAAQQGDDFTVAGATLSFAVGQLSRTFTISAPLDALVEGVEGIQINVLNTELETVATTTALILDGTPEGQTFQLTSGLDTVGTGAPTDLVGSGNNTGTGGNDTIVAVTGEVNLLDPNLSLTGDLTPFDNINGGAGTDTLLVLDNGNPFTSAPNFTGVTVDNVEILDYRAPTRGFLGGAFNVNTAGFDGLTNASFFINSGDTQTITLDDETTSTEADGVTETDVNTSATVTQLGNGNLVINGGGDSLVVTAAEGNVFVGGANQNGNLAPTGTDASNSYETVSITGGQNITVTDRGMQELETVSIVGAGNNISIRGDEVTAISISNLDGAGFRDIDVDVNDTAKITLMAIGDSDADEFDQDFNIESEGDITVETDGTVFGLADLISKGSNVELISNGDLFLSDINALGVGASVSIVANGDVELDNIDGGDENGVPEVFGDNDGGTANDILNVIISGTGSVTMNSVQEANNNADKETTITSTNAGGVTIRDELDNDTQFNGSGNTGDDDIEFGATSEDNTFGGGDDFVEFNSDAFGTDLNGSGAADNTSGSFDGGAGIDTLAMESNNAATFTEDEQEVTNFETLFLTSQNVKQADVIDLHNIGLDTVSNVTSRVGAGSETEVVTITFAGVATSTDSVEFEGIVVDFVDEAGPAALAAAFILQYNAAGTGTWIASAGPNAGDVVLTSIEAGSRADLTADAFDFVDATTIGAPSLEQGTGVGNDDGNAPIAAVNEQQTLFLDDVTLLGGQSITFTWDLDGPGGSPPKSFTYTNGAPGDPALTQNGGALADAIVVAANNNTQTGLDFDQVWFAERDGNNVVFTATGVFAGPVELFPGAGDRPLITITGDLGGGDIFRIEETRPGVTAVAGDDEDAAFVVDGTASANDSVLITFRDNDPTTADEVITVVLADGDTNVAITQKIVDAINLQSALYDASVVPGLTVTLAGISANNTVLIESILDQDLPNLTVADIVFVDDDNIGTPAVSVAAPSTQGSTSSVTLENFIAGSTLTLLAAQGDHTVKLKDDGDSDVLDIVLGADGDHGVVTAEDIEIATISTANNDTDGELPVNNPTPQPGEGDADALLLESAVLEQVTVSGSDGLALDTTSGVISSIDASGEAGFFSWSADAIQEVDITVSTGSGGSRVDFSAMTISGGNASAGTAPVTFLGGSGDDIVITGGIGKSRGTITTGDGNDTVFVGIVDGGNDFWSITDFDEKEGATDLVFDVLDFAGPITFLGRDQELEPTAIFQDYLDQAARGTAGTVRYFWYDEDGDGTIDATYVVKDNSDGEDFVDGADTVIRLEGEVTLTADNFI